MDSATPEVLFRNRSAMGMTCTTTSIWVNTTSAVPSRQNMGARAELHDAINALHGYVLQGGQLRKVDGARYVHVYVDIVLNQKFGGEPRPGPLAGDPSQPGQSNRGILGNWL